MRLFGKKKRQSMPEPSDAKQLTLEDLITLERYDEAEEKVRQHLKLYPKDLHSHLKLAEIHLGLKKVQKALDEFIFVADSYADDGFYQKAIALLGKAAKLAPGDDSLPKRIERYRTMKKLEGRRQLVIEGLKENITTQASSAANRALEIEMMWNQIVKSHLVHELEGEKLKKLFSVMLMDRIEEGQVLAENGSKHQRLYLIVSGEIEALATVGAQTYTIRGFTTGNVIGESTLLERKAWPARYVVKEPGTVFVLDRDGLAQAMRGNDDPVSFLSTLRRQGHDRNVAVNLAKLHRSGS